jgi:hypothetical protein
MRWSSSANGCGRKHLVGNSGVNFGIDRIFSKGSLEAVVPKICIKRVQSLIYSELINYILDFFIVHISQIVVKFVSNSKGNSSSLSLRYPSFFNSLLAYFVHAYFFVLGNYFFFVVTTVIDTVSTPFSSS